MENGKGAERRGTNIHIACSASCLNCAKVYNILRIGELQKTARDSISASVVAGHKSQHSMAVPGGRGLKASGFWLSTPDSSWQLACA